MKSKSPESSDLLKVPKRNVSAFLNHKFSSTIYCNTLKHWDTLTAPDFHPSSFSSVASWRKPYIYVGLITLLWSPWASKQVCIHLLSNRNTNMSTNKPLSKGLEGGMEVILFQQRGMGGLQTSSVRRMSPAAGMGVTSAGVNCRAG